MTTVTGAPSASPYAKNLREDLKPIRQSANEIQTLAHRIQSLCRAAEDATDDFIGTTLLDVRVSAASRIMDFLHLIEQQAIDITFNGEAIEAAELHGRKHDV